MSSLSSTNTQGVEYSNLVGYGSFSGDHENPLASFSVHRRERNALQVLIVQHTYGIVNTGGGCNFCGLTAGATNAVGKVEGNHDKNVPL